MTPEERGREKNSLRRGTKGEPNIFVTFSFFKNDMKQIQWILIFFHSGWWVFFILLSLFFSMSQIFNNLKKNSVILFSAVTIYLPDFPYFNRSHHLQVQTIDQWKRLHFGVVRSHTAEGIQAEVRWALHIIKVVCTEGEGWALWGQMTLLIYSARALGTWGAVLGAEFHTHKLVNTDHGNQNNSFHSCHFKIQINASIFRIFW